MDLPLFFEYLFLGLLGGAMLAIAGVSVVVIRRLFKGQS